MKDGDIKDAFLAIQTALDRISQLLDPDMETGREDREVVDEIDEAIIELENAIGE